MNKIIDFFSILFLLLPTFIQAQTTKEEFFSDATFTSGIYRPYNYENTVATPVPNGYKPFYISHYGRHGSRWLTSAHYYENPKRVLWEAHEANKLTNFGESVYSRVKILAENAKGRYGALSQLGADEHKGIAERMFRSFPEVFLTKHGRKCFIYSRSTDVPRCILSMTSNNERLKELNPEIEIFREAVDRNAYLNNENPNRITCKDSISAIYHDFFNKHFDTHHFLSSIFSDISYAEKLIGNDPCNFFIEMYSMVADIRDIDHLNISMSDIFSKEELFILWQTTNLIMYYNCGPSSLNGEASENSAAFLLKDILDCADNAIKNGKVSADFRFGHDTYTIPLLALMDIKGMNVVEPDPDKVYRVWSNFKVSPMGVNLQVVFFRNEKTGDVIIKLLHCEKEVEIPIETDISPYYHWKDAEAYYRKKLETCKTKASRETVKCSASKDRTETIREKLMTRDKNSVIVVSHRGDWRNFPENSLPGIASAIKMGVDIVEIDVQRTKDGQLILMHDKTLDRTTTGNGKISEWTLDSIKTLKLKNGCAVRTKEAVPTLKEALLLAKGKVLLNLDKADRYFDEVYALLEQTGTTRQIIIKGNKPAREVKEKFGKYLNEVIYMPIVHLNKPDALSQIKDILSVLNPVAMELLYVSDANPLPVQLNNYLDGKSLIWYNTLWDTMAGGHDDDQSLEDPDKGYGYLIDQLNARILQTDRPAYLIEYLKKKGFHQ